MRHSFSVVEEMDAPIPVLVAAYLDCEHYVYLHRSLTDNVEVVAAEGFKVTVRQTWKAWGLTLGHYKTGQWVPPAEFLVYDVKPYPSWFPSPHHFMGLATRLRYTPSGNGDRTMMTFDVDLDLPFFLWPFRFVLQRLIEKMHAQQNDEDMAMIRRREKLYGRGNISSYLAKHHFCYHKDEFTRLFGPQAKTESRS
jgi:hypothetical protein